MVRRYAEPVRVGVEFAPAPRPAWFIWRGRRYAVRVVLAHWRERRAWWREALDPPAGVPHGIAAAARERLVWRVEAVAGRSLQPGVFDLACDEPASEFTGEPTVGPAAGPAADPMWQLLRVSD